MSDIIDLIVDEPSVIPLEVSEAFIDVSANLQANKNASPAASQVIVTPDPGYDAMEKVTVAAIPEGALAAVTPTINTSTGVVTAVAGVATSGYIADTETETGTLSLDTQVAKTVTPTTSEQTAVAAGKYTTGAVKVAAIPGEYIIPMGAKSITSNGSGVDVASYATANVNVPNTYAAGDEGKVVSNGALVAQTSDTVTANGTVDTTLINSLTVNVSGGQATFVGIANDTIVFGEGNQPFGSAPTEDVVFNLQDFYINTHNFYKNIGVGSNGKKTITFNCKGFSRTGTSNMNQMFNGCKAFDTVVFNCSVNPWVEMGAYSFAGANCQVENILGTPISLNTYNLQGTTTDSAFKDNTYLKEIRFYENYSKPKIGFPNSSLLSDDSLISLANGLTFASSASTLTLHATSKAKLPNIMGTVSQVTRESETYDKFTASASGTVTLENFISTTKGWTIA